MLRQYDLAQGDLDLWHLLPWAWLKHPDFQGADADHQGRSTGSLGSWILAALSFLSILWVLQSQRLWPYSILILH